MPPKRKAPPTFSQPRRGSKNLRLVLPADDASAIDLSDPAALPPRAVAAVQKSVSAVVDMGAKGVFRGLKKAKGFEKQKLVKRIKGARDKKDAAAEEKLVAELDEVKRLDIHPLAREHILRTLGKEKRVLASALFPQELKAEAGKKEDGDEQSLARRNVVARLYSAPVVREAVRDVVAGVKSAMGLEDTAGASKGKGEDMSAASKVTARKEAVDEEEDAEDADSESAEEDGGEDGEDGDSEESEWKGFSTPDEPTDAEADADDVLAKYNFESRLVASSDEDSAGSDSASAQGDELQRTDDEWSGSEDGFGDGEDEDEDEDEDNDEDARTPRPRSGRRARSLSLSPSLSDSDAADIAPRSKKRKPHPALQSLESHLQYPAGSGSTFLPSLMAGYISGTSDSDSDTGRKKGKKGGKDEKRGPAEKKLRKNRPGQQARRRIWEAKYGAQANHVKKEAQEQGWRDKAGQLGDGRGAGRGEGDGERGRGKGGGGGRGGRGGMGAGMGRRGSEGRAGADGEGVGKQEKKEEGPLHPSWEAARKAKEKQKAMSAALSKPMGKKITFD